MNVDACSLALHAVVLVRKELLLNPFLMRPFHGRQSLLVQGSLWSSRHQQTVCSVHGGSVHTHIRSGESPVAVFRKLGVSHPARTVHQLYGMPLPLKVLFHRIACQPWLRACQAAFPSQQEVGQCRFALQKQASVGSELRLPQHTQRAVARELWQSVPVICVPWRLTE
jgi:hypothetical protein